MRKLVLLSMVLFISCHTKNKNQLIGTWQLIKKTNDHQVIFEFDPLIHSKKYLYLFKDDSTLITQDDDGGNRQVNKYQLSNEKLILFDSLHTNEFIFKKTGNILSLKSVFSPFNLRFRKLD